MWKIRRKGPRRWYSFAPLSGGNPNPITDDEVTSGVWGEVQRLGTDDHWTQRGNLRARMNYDFSLADRLAWGGGGEVPFVGMVTGEAADLLMDFTSEGSPAAKWPYRASCKKVDGGGYEIQAEVGQGNGAAYGLQGLHSRGRAYYDPFQPVGRWDWRPDPEREINEWGWLLIGG